MIKQIRNIVFLLLNCTALCLPAQTLHFQDSIQNTGTITEDDNPRTYYFKYRNNSSRTIKITRIKTHCGCAQPSYKKGPIAPGEQGQIGITFYPLGRVGKMNRSILVFTNESDSVPDSKLTLIGEVLPSSDPYIDYAYAIGPLRLMQTTVNFGKLSPSTSQMNRIEVVNSGNQPLKITTSDLPEFLDFMTEPEILKPQEKGDLILIIHPKKIKGKGKIDQHFFLEGVGKVPTIQREMNIKGFLK